MSDSVTLLRCAIGCRAIKSWPTTETCHDYDLGSRFRVHSAPVASFDDLAALLGRLHSLADVCIIRGELNADADPTSALRRSVTPPAHFSSTSRQWVCLDVDDRLDPDLTFATHPHVHAHALREELPAPFRTAACYWHASGSAGIKPGVRLHLWFWLDRAVSDQEWRAWAQQWTIRVDSSLFRAVQPHYTGNPSLGFADPMAARAGILTGEPAVQVPNLIGASDALHDVAEKVLNKALHAIRCAEPGERNDTLYRLTHLTARYAPVLGERGKQAIMNAALKKGMGATEVHATVNSAWANAKPHPACDASAWARGMQLTDKGTFAVSDANVMQCATEHPALQGVFVTDARTYRPLVNKPPPWDPDELRGPYPRPLVDSDGAGALLWFDRECRLPGISHRYAFTAIAEAASNARVDLFKDWLEQVEHDGVPRLDTWLSVATRSDDDPDYLKAVGSKWLISAVARTFRPGCQADHALILVGPQGARKSSLFLELAGDAWFRVLQTKLGADDAYLQLQGPVIVELAELAALRGKDIETVKSDITVRVDERRPKYGRAIVSMPRRCVYAGSTNEDSFLHDTTGNRRFWPVNVGQIDLEWVKDNRTQLWAEAAARFRNGEAWWLDQAENALACAIQEDARETDLMEDMLREYLDTPQGSHTAFDARLPPDQLDSTGRPVRILSTQAARALEARVDVSAGRRLASAFRALGWDQRRSSGHDRARYYVKVEGETPF